MIFFLEESTVSTELELGQSPDSIDQMADDWISFIQLDMMYSVFW